MTPDSVNSKIASSDTMYDASNPERYFAVGNSALKAIERARAGTGAAQPTRILDLGCGYGRVLRTLAAAYPNAALTACDIDAEAVQFCAETFGAEPLLGLADPEEMEFGEPFDLIWSGSLLTHVDWHAWSAYLTLFQRALSPAGVAMFSFHGKYVAERLKSSDYPYGLSPRQRELVVHSYEDSGFGYHDYKPDSAYGISLSSPSWVLRAIDSRPLRVVHLHERGWAEHQDLVGCTHW